MTTRRDLFRLGAGAAVAAAALPSAAAAFPAQETVGALVARSLPKVVPGFTFPRPRPAAASLDALCGAGPRTVTLNNLHTGEVLDCTFWKDGAYLPTALTDANRMLRDFRTGEQHVIDRGLLDLLHVLRTRAGPSDRLQLISGYRSPKTNAMLRERGGGQAKSSLHMKGMAADIRAPGVALDRLRDLASDLRIGGVGYYPVSGFVHVDTGDVRRWRGV